MSNHTLCVRVSRPFVKVDDNRTSCSEIELGARDGAPPPSIAMVAAFQSYPVYHLNPMHLGQIPVNMDVADLRGDIFFDLSSKTMPLSCQNGSAAHASHHDCTNPETQASDLVVSKLELEVRGDYGEYAACNVCPPSGIDDYSGLTCTPSTYICTCRVGGSHKWPWKLERCNNHTAVGRQEVAAYFRSWPPCSWDTWIGAPYACWWLPVVNVTGGVWYSTTEGGWCDAAGANQSTCTWRASLVKVVNRTCSDHLVHSAIEAYDSTRGDGCFQSCPNFGAGRARNTSDPCWIYCLYATISGPSALLPGGRQHAHGMDVKLLEEAFERPFLPVHQGGCPNLAQSEPVG